MYKLLPILLFAYGLAVTTEDIYDNSYALIIGIDKYENISNLDYAVEDAKSIKKMLIDKFQFSNDKITLLLNKDATYRKIKKALSKVTRKAGDNDRILIFFSGHGETFRLPEGGSMGFLIPVDGEKDDLYATSLEMDELRKVTSLSKAKHILYLVDACYGGLAASNTRSLDISVPGFLEKITRDKSRQIITAGGRGEKVIEKAEWGHSAFTLNILRGLNDWTADTNWDGFITAEELGIFLKNRVTKDSDGQQTPVSGRFTSHEGEFVFINNNPTQIINNSPSNSISLNQKIEQIKIDFQEFEKHGITEIDDIPINEYRDSLINELQLGKTSSSDNNSFDNNSFNEIIKELKKEIAFLKEKQSSISESELLERLASLENELNKPLRLIQGCTDDKAENYNPYANLDDESCIILKGEDAYVRFGEFNSSDSTLDVFITAYRRIYDLEFQTQGFKIEKMMDGILSKRGFSVSSNDTEQGSWYFALSIRGYFPLETSALLFKAKVLPNDNTFCIENINTTDFNNIFIGECITVDFHRKPQSYIHHDGKWAKSGVVGYTSDTPIAGFQFNVGGASVTGASGGAAGEAGFMVSNSANMVIGFSTIGTTIPAGEGALIVLEVDDNTANACLSGITISDSEANSLDYTVENCHVIHIHSSVIYGCTDIDACNFNVHVSKDDGSCDYPLECYDCAGNCTCGVDCAGDCGGKSKVDRCGVCNGDGSSCK